ncbi:Lrp/AsnC family transcriptional regulator [Galactobacter caseinivorans]|uniref:Lrp/AsnC family transcriptional regulator n=1 Tax=Galactobacter caseinivorans TaxID=2676123 RepID=A0A496PJM4_9MICC|nr:Lrp/AsnC family transcriptional regulator [Galactobacter caseinivorans]RKW70704.1 Lrp/AsnC family transcriptional regulator [Galactobacter caseinivorans]
MDALDWQILSTLQDDGRLTVTQLAERVGLSVSPCHRRLRALETEGIITGYRAMLDAQRLGFGFETLLFVTLEAANHTTIPLFEAAVSGLPNVILAQRLIGETDYLLRVVTRDLAAFQQLYDEQLSALPGVRRLTTTLVMKSVVPERMLPLAR